MSQKSIGEYALALRRRYLAVGKKGETAMLNEFCRTTGYHRKLAIRLLRHPPTRTPCRRGRRRQYQLPLLQPLKKLWEASDHLCSKRLEPFIPEMVAALERQGELQLEPEVKEQLLKLSAATIDRLLKPSRQQERRRAPTARLAPLQGYVSRFPSALSLSGRT